MARNDFKEVSINVSLNSYMMSTTYELYDWGHQVCSSTPAFLLPRGCSNDELTSHIMLCYNSSGTISNNEYDNLGGFDSCRKIYKLKSIDRFYRFTVGFTLSWENKRVGFFKLKKETIVHICVWKYRLGQKGHDQADDVFELKYDEERLEEFVKELRLIMDEMYEKYLGNTITYQTKLFDL